MEHFGVDLNVGINSTAISSAETLLGLAVKPDNGVDAARKQLLGGSFFLVRLYQEQHVVDFLLTTGQLEFRIWFVATDCLFEQLRLRISCREVHKDPAFLLLKFFQLHSFLLQLVTFRLERFDFLLF